MLAGCAPSPSYTVATHNTDKVLIKRNSVGKRRMIPMERGLRDRRLRFNKWSTLHTIDYMHLPLVVKEVK